MQSKQGMGCECVCVAINPNIGALDRKKTVYRIGVFHNFAIAQSLGSAIAVADAAAAASAASQTTTTAGDHLRRETILQRQILCA